VLALPGAETELVTRRMFAVARTSKEVALCDLASDLVAIHPASAV
jgi:hypothetical protein